jgi:hypothetical protein
MREEPWLLDSALNKVVKMPTTLERLRNKVREVEDLWSN